MNPVRYGETTGKQYVAVSGQKIIDEGIRKPTLCASDGLECQATLSVGDVRTTLLSAESIVKNRYRIILDDEGSYALHKRTDGQVDPHRSETRCVQDNFLGQANVETERVAQRNRF